MAVLPPHLHNLLQFFWKSVAIIRALSQEANILSKGNTSPTPGMRSIHKRFSDAENQKLFFHVINGSPPVQLISGLDNLK